METSTKDAIIAHGWKWAIVGLLALIILPFVLAIAHNLESGRDRDDDRTGGEDRGN